MAWLTDQNFSEATSWFGPKKGAPGLLHDHCLGTELKKALFFDFVYTNETCGEANLQLHILVLAAVGEQRCGRAIVLDCNPPPPLQYTPFSVVNADGPVCYAQELASQRPTMHTNPNI